MYPQLCTRYWVQVHTIYRYFTELVLVRTTNIGTCNQYKIYVRSNVPYVCHVHWTLLVLCCYTMMFYSYSCIVQVLIFTKVLLGEKNDPWNEVHIWCKLLVHDLLLNEMLYRYKHLIRNTERPHIYPSYGGSEWLFRLNI